MLKRESIKILFSLIYFSFYYIGLLLFLKIPFDYRSTERSNGTTKMIQRLVGGHLHHSVYRKVENDFSSQSPNRLSKLYFRRKPVATTTASLFTSTQPTSTIATTVSLATTADAKIEATSKVKTKPNENVFIVQAEKYDEAKAANEAANQVISYKSARDRFVESGAGEGKDEGSGPKKQDDSKKTLADQVADGKYALIQNELFSKKPKRPGIISYLSNPEVPNDTADNLGGLSSDDIWLAEDHLLVLKGGGLNSASDKEPWKPIDDYVAPMRQVKIPDNPKVPPPFLVQLEENGPIQFIGDNKLPLINPFTNESLLLFHENGFPKTETYSRDKANLYARPGAPNTLTFNSTAIYGGGVNNNNVTFSNPFLSPRPEHIPNFVGPPPPFGPPFGPFAFMPNGSLENSNFTDFIDEEDPSFYYPPPYSFVYKPNYTNPVEPGPLVPGIILPPPPNFFGRLSSGRKNATANGTTTTRPLKQVLRPIASRPSTTPSTTTVLPITYKTVSWKNTRPSKAYVNNLIQSTTPVTTTTSTTRLPRVKVTQLKKVTGPEILTFGPKEAIKIGSDSLITTKGKPIYYEYFDAREKSRPITTTLRTPTTQAYPRPYNAYLPIKPSNYEKYSHSSSKPKDATSINVVKLEDYRNDALLSPPTPEKAFTSEIENIRHTIEFFKSQQKQQKVATTQPPSSTIIAFPTRNPKTKTVYDYTYDRAPLKNSNGKTFVPPTEFDSTPFKPMVHYSPPLNSNNGFKGIAYSTVPTVSSIGSSTSSTTTSTTESPYSTFYANEQFASKPYSGRVQYIPIDTSVLRSLPITTKNPFNQYYKTLPVDSNADDIQSNLKYSTARPLLSIEKQVLREVQPKEINVQIQSHTPTVGTNTAPYESSYVDAKSVIPHPIDAFYYRQPPPPPYSISYQHQSAAHPTLSPVKSAQQNAYLRQIEMLRQELEGYPNQYHVRVANASRPYLNFRQSRPLGHPNPNIISSYHWETNRFPQLSDILSPNYGGRDTNQQQRLPTPQVQTLHKDIFVNYRYPLPPIDPDSELLPPVLAPVPPPLPTPTYYSRYGRLHRAPSPPAALVQYKLPGDQQAGVYFYTSHETKRRNTDEETKN